MGATAKGLLQLGVEATPGTIVSAKRLWPGEASTMLKLKHDTPKEQRGSFDPYFSNQQILTRDAEWKSKGEYYPEDMLALWSGCISNAPTIAGAVGFSTWTFAPTDTLNTFTIEEFDGTQNWHLQWGIPHKVEIDFGADKVLDVSVEGIALDKNTLTSLAVVAQPVALPFTGAQGRVYIDAAGGTMGTTQMAQLMTYKCTIDLGIKPTRTANSTPLWDNTYRGYRKIEVEMEIDFTDTVEYAHFRQGDYRYVSVAFSGPNIAGTAQPYTFAMDVPLLYETWEIDRSKEHVTAKVKGTAQFDSHLGYSHQVVLTAAAGSITGF